MFILIIQTLLKFRNKLLFNQFVEPRENAKHTGGDIHILFCREGILGPREVFQPNHKFVVAGHALGHTFGHALHFLFDYPFKNPRSTPVTASYGKVNLRSFQSVYEADGYTFGKAGYFKVAKFSNNINSAIFSYRGGLYRTRQSQNLHCTIYVRLKIQVV